MAGQAKVWNGAKGLRRLLVPIGDLKPHPRNPRRHNLDAIAASLQEFGQQKPIVALTDGTIVAGHGTTEAAREKLNWTHLAVIQTDLTEDEIEAYLVADNRTSDLASYEQTVLIEVLNDLAEQGKLAGTGYTPDDLDDLVAEADAIAEAARQRFDGGFSENDAEIQARSDLRQGGEVMREVVLMMDQGQYEEFSQNVKLIRKELGLGGIIETVVETVNRYARQLNQAPA